MYIREYIHVHVRMIHMYTHVYRTEQALLVQAMFPVPHGRHGPQCHTADMSAVSDSRHACCVTQQTFLMCDTADTSTA